MKAEDLIQFITKDLNDLNTLSNSISTNKEIAGLELEIAINKAKNLYNALILLRQSSDFVVLQQEEPVHSVLPQETAMPFSSLTDEAGPDTINEKTAEPVSGKKPEGFSSVTNTIAETEEEGQSFYLDDQEEISIEAPSSPEEETEEPAMILGENFSAKTSLNDLMGENISQISTRQEGVVTDINDAIGLNDRFLFIRELFENDTIKYNDAINHLNVCESIQDAVVYLKQNFRWQKNEASTKFLNLVKRKFSN